ncbi:hypothetical protein PUNSTDRAFT_55738 [Punctularia strigosozonata HHB-11173 SS5]|uniref:Uncharacterized protein n=1 Tax=Punctularia strigosozonata (strain HHB-11173) TaxID=741275 RepID=R7S1B6_PUNST|nr:uncharacterized protein PUNSTDRAFT_55738 [Punctularia strigosozonata HHB-11173 SS5]EIN04170.1 hypothetical protein PUNSTDRAFT_55738 [Punctularia strigosozonata HHB-11173 SS5]
MGRTTRRVALHRPLVLHHLAREDTPPTTSGQELVPRHPITPALRTRVPRTHRLPAHRPP